MLGLYGVYQPANQHEPVELSYRTTGESLACFFLFIYTITTLTQYDYTQSSVSGTLTLFLCVRLCDKIAHHDTANSTDLTPAEDPESSSEPEAKSCCQTIKQHLGCIKKKSISEQNRDEFEKLFGRIENGTLNGKPKRSQSCDQLTSLIPPLYGTDKNRHNSDRGPTTESPSFNH